MDTDTTITPTLLEATPLLDFGHPSITEQIVQRGWHHLVAADRVGSAYTFVRDEIAFGYNRMDAMPASEVLKDGFGQCNTKGILLMALLRALGIPCRVHGFLIHKDLQRGLVPPLVYPLAPAEILHSWVEVSVDGQTHRLEGFILDTPYLARLQSTFAGMQSVCGYGVGTDCFAAPPIDWNNNDTFIQQTGIKTDLGIYDTPDALYAQHGQHLSAVKAFLYRTVIRRWMNSRVAAIRSGSLTVQESQLHHHGQAPPRDSRLSD